MPKTKAAPALVPNRNVAPDKLDLRDRPYLPAVAIVPPPVLTPKLKLPVLHQGQTSACTGFALASVVNSLLRQSSRQPARAPAVSPFMIYSMARRYDEFPGATEDTGSSLRGAMKGWYRHGVCRQDLWESIDMPDTPKTPAKDWWLDAAQRPLGAYYRVDTRSITDMHVALNEVGILYASAVCHDRWMEGVGAKSAPGEFWPIPFKKADPDDGGHAFAIVGYNSFGFIIQNSWGEGWGSKGLAVLTYEDWSEHAMDCWVAQLGVVTEQHLQIAKSVSLRTVGGKTQLASDAVLRARELDPFIVDMENNGKLSTSGIFRTQESDLDDLVTIHLGAARKAWKLAPEDPIDVAIYAHGGLTGEEDAAQTVAKWVPALYDAQIFPIFLMWETDIWSTLRNRLADVVFGVPKPTAGFTDQLKRFWNQRLERLLAPAGTAVWGEMKQNAAAISGSSESGGVLLYHAAQKSGNFAPGKVRLHLIGHSAGSIVHSHLIEALAPLGWTFETVNFLAAAVTVEEFAKSAFPHVKSGAVRRLNSFHLSDAVEQQDPTCKPILGYSRSLLYLVSESFEHGKRTPILGMEKYAAADPALQLSNIAFYPSPGPAASSTTHGGFDDDALTLRSVLSLIKQK